LRNCPEPGIRHPDVGPKRQIWEITPAMFRLTLCCGPEGYVGLATKRRRCSTLSKA
jgi:hypothetical protein